MAVTYKDFLDSADVMLRDYDKSSSEIDLRNCISRTYYAAYLFSRDSIPLLNLGDIKDQSASRGVHEEVCNKYRNSGKSLSAVSSMLYASHKMRCIADYKLDTQVLKANAEKHRSSCVSIIHRIESALRAASSGTAG